MIKLLTTMLKCQNNVAYQFKNVREKMFEYVDFIRCPCLILVIDFLLISDVEYTFMLYFCK